MGFGGLEFRVWGLGFRVEGLTFAIVALQYRMGYSDGVGVSNAPAHIPQTLSFPSKKQHKNKNKHAAKPPSSVTNRTLHLLLIARTLRPTTRIPFCLKDFNREVRFPKNQQQTTTTTGREGEQPFGRSKGFTKGYHTFFGAFTLNLNPKRYWESRGNERNPVPCHRRCRTSSTASRRCRADSFPKLVIGLGGLGFRFWGGLGFLQASQLPPPKVQRYD